MNALVYTLMMLLTTAAQSPRNGVVLRGSVVRAGTTEPVRGAVIITLPSGVVVATAVTDDAGKFQFANILPGAYRISATADGYVKGEYGQRGPTGVGLPLNVVPSQAATEITLRLTPLAAISGRVYSSAGNPLPNVNVQLLKAMYVDGRRTMLVWQVGRTNEFGDYRIDALQQGTYVIGAFAPGSTTGRGDAYLPIYSPGTIDIDAATFIDVLPGLEYGGVDVATSDKDALRIRGRVIDGLTRTPPSSFFVALSPRNQQTVIGGSTSPRRVSVASDGGFEIGGLAPGSYELIATLGDGENRLAARVTVEARDRDVQDLQLTLEPAFQIAGRITIDGPPSPDDARNFAGMRVSLVQEPFIAQVSPLPVPVDENGGFVLKGMIPGDYRIRIAAEFDSFIRRASWGAADILNSVVRIDGDHGDEIYVNLDRHPGALDAAIYDEKDSRAAGVPVVLAPDAPNRERLDLYRTGLTDAAGGVHFEGLEPGDYKLFSWEYIESGAWQDVNFLRLYEDLGKRVHVSEGGQERADVKLILGRR